jgi:hypothetical protein
VLVREVDNGAAAFFLALAPGRYVVHSGFFGSRGGTRTVRIRTGEISRVAIRALIAQKGGEPKDATAPRTYKGPGAGR